MNKDKIKLLIDKTEQLKNDYELTINYQNNPLLIKVDRFIEDLDKHTSSVSSERLKEEKYHEEKEFQDQILPFVVTIAYVTGIFILLFLVLSIFLHFANKGVISDVFERKPELKFGLTISYLGFIYLAYPKGKSIYHRLIKRDEHLSKLYTMENSLVSMHRNAMDFREELNLLLKNLKSFSFDIRQETVEGVFRINSGYMIKTKTSEYFIPRFYEDDKEIHFIQIGDIINVMMLPEIEDGVLKNSDQVYEISNLTRDLTFSPYKDSFNLVNKINLLKNNFKH